LIAVYSIGFESSQNGQPDLTLLLYAVTTSSLDPI
jgi:hypothetical protein